MIFNLVTKYIKLCQKDNHHRYKSWEHCYTFFEENYKNLEEKKEYASLHLAFYLASWGMLRGSSFLLQKDYLIHKYFIEEVVMNENYHQFFKEVEISALNLDVIEEMIQRTKNAYEKHISMVNGKNRKIELTDTLVSKILLGVFGNVPAYDRYFVEGLKLHGISGKLNKNSLLQIISFYLAFEEEFNKCQKSLETYSTIKYTPMKLLDMYFWEVGYMLNTNQSEMDEIRQFAAAYKEKILNGRKTISSNSKGINYIRNYVENLLDQAKEDGLTYIELVSGDIHRKLGLKNAMPTVCLALRTLDIKLK